MCKDEPHTTAVESISSDTSDSSGARTGVAPDCVVALSELTAAPRVDCTFIDIC